MRVTNRSDLLGRGAMASVRKIALDLTECGLSAGDSYRAAHQAVTLDGEKLITPDRVYELQQYRRVLVLGAGKASLGIVRALAELLAERIAAGLVVVPAEQYDAGLPRRAMGRIKVIAADHPFPTHRSQMAAREALAFAASATKDDLLICCITGGSSALIAAPPDGVGLVEKARLHRLLLSCGAAIDEVNAVRKQVSRIKGGRLAKAAAGATILNLTVSDVVGDAPDLITDPTVPDTSTPTEAIEILREWGLWDDVPPSIRAYLSRDIHAPALADTDICTIILTSGAMVCTQVLAEARRTGLPAFSLGSSLGADAAQLGAILASIARESHHHGQPFPKAGVLVACGGESTVSLDGAETYGLGGPNQELAISAALRLDDEAIALASIDTDGSDGGTDYAGALVDGTTHRRAQEAGLELWEELRRHRTCAALTRLGDVIMTGPTGTNVNDLIIAVIAGQHHGELG